ncbi:hypothetical protein GCM10007937_12350 [Mesorhizobium albiziae]|nr:hypothetical protein GCM10007937_12350 [Mesorhizobium albiziae]
MLGFCVSCALADETAPMARQLAAATIIAFRLLVFRIVMLLSEISWNEPVLSRQGFRPKMLADVVPDLLSAMSPYDRIPCKGRQTI